jgi:hypothetical protein
MEISTTTTTNPVNMYDQVNQWILNPVVFIIVLMIVIIYVIFFASLGKNDTTSITMDTDSSSKGQKMIGIFIAGVLVVLIFINAFQYFFNINITAYVNDLFTNQPKIDIVVNQPVDPAPVPEIKFKKQVFNIPGNYYTYDNAQALCTAYGADLASYDQIEKAYQKGGEWCNYGWSADQMALFPTQQKTYDQLQQTPGHEHDCGRPGVNGGYIANPNVRFGVNCYGNKPKITEQEEDIMNVSTPYPQTVEDLAFQQRVDYWKTRIDEILVSPFNHNTWGSF